MNKTLIRQLNALNRRFYKQVADSFSESRSYYWQGWNKLVPYIQELANFHQDKLTVLDLGCGNGRFGAFLAQQLPDVKLKYIGLDNSQKLLNIATQQTLTPNIKTRFEKLDLTEELLSETFYKSIKKFSPHFITTLGVLHHVPSYQLRQELIANLSKALASPGYLAFTSWNFLDTKRFQKKIIEPQKVNLDPEKLENHDVILDWKRGSTAYRYCHYTDKDELNLLANISGLELISRFKADGKSGKLNTYTILKK